ncbi:hypothetical protein GCM10020218_070230 [Dactylosporangium vinaceum]
MSSTPNLPRRIAGIAAAAAVAAGVFVSSAGVATAAPVAGPAALTAISDAVSLTGVDGIAWYTDAATGQVVVTADSSVDGTELATLQRAGKANSRPCASSAPPARSARCWRRATPSTAASTAARWASTPAAAAPTTC